MDIEDWKSQLKRGSLELCILTLLKNRPYYGYELITVLSNWEIVAAKENTIYPLLRRLTKENFLESYWEDAENGPRRKYYCITPLGIKYLVEMTTQWTYLKLAITDIQKYEEE
ncbi:PadR family transcriptional regulator [Enterococcus rivorum]|uniref:PadR family transcriptional regulator n=1 Tax=Enterococcus rivorum TaxID=762845 RepID=A0A1E5KX30_9ENTE|nr:PadR family transcriptional regulator [Enterococcus rivorum]MBP2097229.1 PadR family transcriptional regulator PadR [Enterococcus rivorum]OEH82417.1 PadR family transcriptional regulator [Enterococcus rivorum]